MSELWTPEAYPAVPPDAKFRQDLQRALEQTHRQQAAQRKLRTRKESRFRIRMRWMISVIVCLVALAVIMRRRAAAEL
jgi:hypothetical protein